MIERSSSSPTPEARQFTGSLCTYARDTDRAGFHFIHHEDRSYASKQGDCVGLIKKPRVLGRLRELPARCWTASRNESRGCQWYTKALFGALWLEVMLDSGAGLNTIPENALLSIINANEEAGIKMSDERHPVVELQSWTETEYCRGVAGGASVPMIGGVILAVTLVDRNTGATRTINVKFKILEAGIRFCDFYTWQALIPIRTATC